MLFPALALVVAALQGVQPVAGMPTGEIAQWAQCLADRYLEVDRPSMSPDEVVDAAFAACRAEERLVEAAERRLGGADVAERMEGTRRGFRNSLDLRVRERRGDPPTGDSTAARGIAWSNCLNQRAFDMAAGAEGAQAIIEAAFQSCGAEERAVAESMSTRFAPAEMRDLFALLRDQVRTVMARTIAQRREGQ